MAEKTLNVVGMHCPSCVMNVELTMKDLDGVDEAKASLDDNTVTVEKKKKKVTDDDLVGAVEEAGFKVE